jgi:hypothetical protein
MRGGALFTPYADYPTSMGQLLPNELVADARLADLNAKFAELPAVEQAAGVSATLVPTTGIYVPPPSSTGVPMVSTPSGLMPMAGGGRRHRRRTMRGGQAAINAPSMILTTPAEEAAARLNPQWYTENTVIPEFRGPLPVPGGGRSSSRSSRSSRKSSSRKSNSRKSSRNSRKSSRNSRKSSRNSRKSSRNSRKSNRHKKNKRKSGSSSRSSRR